MPSQASYLAESDVEDAALEWFGGLGYSVLHGPSIAPNEPHAERSSYGDVFLAGRLKSALARLNPAIPPAALDEALRKVARRDSLSVVVDNHRLHRMLVDGVEVQYSRNGRIVGDRARLLDFDNPANNDWCAVNQLTVVEGQHTRRPDVVVYVNGLPLAVFELKDAANPQATIWDAFAQLQTYKQQIPALMVPNASFIGFTGTPVELADRSTRAVFGDYVSVYDVQQAVDAASSVVNGWRTASRMPTTR